MEKFILSLFHIFYPISSHNHSLQVSFIHDLLFYSVTKMPLDSHHNPLYFS